MSDGGTKDGGPRGEGPASSGGGKRRGRRRPPERTLEQKVDDIHHRLVSRRGAELLGMLDILSSRRKLLWLNFNAGIARGVGFFLGATLIGALALGGVALAFNAAAHSLGFTDVSLEEAVTSSVRKFSEIRDLVKEAETEVQREQAAERARAVGTEPSPAFDLPGGGSKQLR